MMVPFDIRLRGVVLHIIVIKTKVVRITLVLDDHVVEYDACLYYHTQFSLIHVSCRAANDGKSELVEPQMLSLHPS